MTHLRHEKRKNDNKIKDVGNLFRLRKENEAIKDRVIRDFRKLLEHEQEESSHKPVRVGNFWSNSYTCYKNNGDRNKTLFESPFNRCQSGMETSVRGSDFVFI